MKYQPPWGTTDPNGAYINGDPSQGVNGSIPPAACFEQPQREIVNVIAKSGQNPSDTNLLQLTHGVRSQRLNYAVDTSTQVNQILVAYDPPITSYEQGLTLRVRVRATNPGGQVNINAGGGNMPVRRMNGSDLFPGDLPINAIATLVFDGGAFQLSNFGGGVGGDISYESVNIPYIEDTSTGVGPDENLIVAIFNPPITANPAAGDIIAVKIANTCVGPTRIQINNLPATFDLAPNGGGPMLQGDIVAGDVVQFFFDGVVFRFAPNPEMNADVIYTVGPGQQFVDIDQAMLILKRKTIGAGGFVRLKLAPVEFNSPIIVNHPSADRIQVVGTMKAGQVPPVASDFQKSGSAPIQRDSDAQVNEGMLRAKYGTVIRLVGSALDTLGWGLQNLGPGMVEFRDLLVIGARTPTLNGWSWQMGVGIRAGYACRCVNVSVWGAQHGFHSEGVMNCVNSFACAGLDTGFFAATGRIDCQTGGSFGNMIGAFASFGLFLANNSQITANGQYGVLALQSGGAQLTFTDTLLSAQFDLIASVTSTIQVFTPANFGPTSPLVGVIDNLGSLIYSAVGAAPPTPLAAGQVAPAMISRPFISGG